MRCLDVITNSMDMNLSKLQETVSTGKPSLLQSIVSQESNTAATEQQQLVDVRTSLKVKGNG